jgi:hypothetical protein
MSGSWPRRYAVKTPYAVVGFTDLELPLEQGERAAGVFIPGEGFHDVRGVFERYRQAAGDPVRLRQYVAARDGMGMIITDGGTLPLAARVELISVEDPLRLIIHVAIRDDRYWGGAPSSARPPSPLAGLHAEPHSVAGTVKRLPGSAWNRPGGR